MNIPLERVAALEWLNYEASLPIAQATPGLNLILDDQVIITSSDLFPTPDTTHACLLRTTPATADDLITKVIDYFKDKNLPPAIFVSPACTPPDLPQRLQQRGFVKGREDEAWMTLDLSGYKPLKASPKVVVKQVTQAEVPTFAHIFAAAFDIPLDFAPSMVELITPSVGLPGVYYYLGYIDEQPVATFSLICHKKVGIIGSAGVTPGKRGQFVISNLAIKAADVAKQWGAETLILQTTVGVLLERLLRLYGFKKTFTRTSFTLGE